MSTRPERRRGWIIGGAVVLVVAGLVLAPLVLSPIDVPPDLNPTPPTTAAPPAAAAPVECGDPLASLRPTGPSTSIVAGDSYMATIQARGRLRVGVSPTTLLFSAVNPFNGQFEGFDDDIAREVAAALFPGADPAARIEFVAIPQTDRVSSLVDGRVDMVVSTFSINCTRLQDISFSTEYFTSGQRLLVPVQDQDTTLAQLGDDHATVCAANGSTSLDNLRALDPAPEVEGAASHTECLSLLQQGEIDAVSTDDTILAGMVVQDPNVVIVGERMTDEHYGLGLPKGHDDWVRYVNGVLENVRSSGRWAQIYDQWLLEPMSTINPTTPAPPPAVYSD
jgi:polar amino acid transport system substrate-binding protein